MIKKIETVLREHIDIHHLEIIDDSVRHAGHKKDSKGGHYNAVIISNSFIGKSLVQRHQMVYAALGSMLKTEIHAFSMKTLTMDEL